MGTADVEGWLSDYAKAITIEDMGKFIMVTKEYDASEQGRQVWREVNDIVKAHGGEWVSAGRGSHWAFHKSTEHVAPAEQPPKPVGKLTQTQLVQEGMAFLTDALRLHQQSEEKFNQGMAKLKEAYKKA